MTTEVYAEPSREQIEAIAGNVRLITEGFTDLSMVIPLPYARRSKCWSGWACLRWGPMPPPRRPAAVAGSGTKWRPDGRRAGPPLLPLAPPEPP